MPASIQSPKNDLEFDFNDFEEQIFQFAQESFERIFSECDQQIYALTLYYSGPNWSYLFPSFNTEEGLELTAQEKDALSPHSAENKAQMYRWCPYDWRYHLACESWGEALDPLLDKVRSFGHDLHESTGNEAYQQFTSALEQRAIQALRRTCQLPEIQARWDRGELLLINLLDWDSGNDVDVSRAEAIGNPAWVMETYTKGSLLTEDLYETHFEGLSDTPAPDVSPESLLPWVKKYNPDFKLEDGILTLNKADSAPCLDADPGEYELRENTIEILELLEGHPHFSELSAYYNSLAFRRSKSGDPLFEFGRTLAHHILEKLQVQFPDSRFLAVLPGKNRLCLHVFTDRGILPETAELYVELAEFTKGMETLVLKSHEGDTRA